jgi:hypothetical protein
MKAPAWAGALGASAALAAAYLLFGARDITLGDGPELAVAAATGGVAHPPGYPLFLLLGRVFVAFGEPYPALATMNALLGGAAALFLGLAALRVRALLAPDGEPAAVWHGIAAVSLCGMLPDLARAATVVEVYALGACLGGALLWVCAPRAEATVARSAAAGVLCGCLAANHLPMLALAAIPAAWLWGQRAPFSRHIAAGAAGLATLAGLYALLPLWASGGEGPRLVWGEPSGIAALVTHIRGGEYAQFRMLQLAPGHRLTFPQWTAFAVMRLQEFGDLLQPGLAGVPRVLAVLGAAFAARRLWREFPLPVLAAGAAFLAQFAFVFLYTIADAEDYFLGALLALVPLALGLALAQRWGAHPALAAAAALSALALASHEGTRARRLSTRPWLEATLAALPENAVVITHGDADTYSLWYAQMAEGRRRDLLVYGANFSRFPWFARTFAGHPLAGEAGFRPGAPGTLHQHAEALDRLVIAPIAGKAPLFSTQPDGAVLAEWQRRYGLEPAAELPFTASPSRGATPPLLLRLIPQRPLP